MTGQNGVRAVGIGGENPGLRKVMVGAAFRWRYDRGTPAVAEVAWILWSNVHLLREHFHAELDALEGGGDPTGSE